MDYPYVILIAIVISFLFAQVNLRAASPVMAIVDRWLKWFIFAFAAAQLCHDFQIINRPYWVLVIVFFVVWFLVETLYNWLAISALSVSPLPLFPRYAVNQSGEEWPVQPRFLKLREWLRARGFRPAQALKAEIDGGIYLRSSVHQNAAGTIRIQVTFIPQRSTSVAAFCAVTSWTAKGNYYLTDNLYIPFAGFFPENWYVERSPWRRSLERLLKRHEARLRSAGEELVAFTHDPLQELNSAQSELDRLNTELGFLYPRHEREDLGRSPRRAATASGRKSGC